MTIAQTEAEVAEIISDAVNPLSIQGGGTRGVATPGDLLDTSGLTGVELYEPGALTLVSSSGTNLAEINKLLASESQQLAFEPMDHRGLMGSSGEPTIGGVVAANVSGPRRIQAGACRDHLLGVRFVDGAGTVIKNGGRVMKNVTGYDLVKLMTGSWGTLGVLTQVSLKVLPRPETQSTLLLSGSDLRQAVKAMSAALGSPFEVTGAAYDPGDADGQSTVFIRIEGFPESVGYRIQRLTDLLGGFGEVHHTDTPEQSDEIWKNIRDVKKFHGADGDVWRVSVRPSDAPKLVERMDAKGVLMDWGGGLIWVLVVEGDDLRTKLGHFRGHATLVRAADATKDNLGVFQPEPEPLKSISAGLRARFDPKGILNQGLMG